MAFVNTDFSQSSGLPATIFGTSTPVTTELGQTTLDFTVNGELVSVDVDINDTSVSTLATLLGPHGILVTDDSGTLRLDTERVGETATLEIVPSFCAENFGLYGKSTGLSYHPSPLGWTVTSFTTDISGFSQLEFENDYDAFTENFGYELPLKTGAILEIGSGGKVETFGGWPPGGMFFMETGTFLGLSFSNPSDIEIADGGSIDAPAGHPTEVVEDVMTQSNWYVPNLDSAFTALVFGPGSTTFDVFAELDNDPDDVTSLYFGRTGYNLTTTEKFRYSLQGDVVITCNDGSPADVVLALVHKDLGSGTTDADLSGNLSFTIPDSLQSGTGASVAALLVGKLRENPTIYAYQLTPDQLSYSSSDDARMVVVFSADPLATRVEVSLSSGNIATRQNKFDHSASPIDGIPVIPEIHFIRRYRFGYL